MKRKLIFGIFPILFMFLMFTSPVSQTLGAAGTTGSIEIGTTSAFDGAIVAVRCYGLEVSADYTVNHTGDDTGFSFTTGASQVEFTVYLTIDKPAASETVYINLFGSAATFLDTVTLQVKDDSLIPDSFLITLGITLLVLFLIVGIVTRMRR